MATLRILRIFLVGSFTWIFLPCLILACLLTAACTSTAPGDSRWYAPATWFKGSEGKALEKADAALESAKDKALKAALERSYETQRALAAAARSRAIEVATHSNDQAYALLSQVAGPLTAEQIAALNALVAGLVSDNEAIRAQAEKDRAENDALVARLSAQLAAKDAARDKRIAALQASYEIEHAEAQAARAAKALWAWLKWGLILAAGVIGLAQILPLLALRFPAFRAASTLVTGVVSPGLTYVAHQLHQGHDAIGRYLATKPAEVQAETIAALDPHTNHLPAVQRIIRTARQAAAAP